MNIHLFHADYNVQLKNLIFFNKKKVKVILNF